MREDLRQAVRTLIRARSTTLSVSAILALGIAATVATLTLADSVLVRPLPYPESERLVTIYEQNLEARVERMLLSYPNFRELVERDSLERVAAYQAFNSLTLTGADESIRVQSNFVSQEYFSLVGAPLAIGSFFGPEAHSGPMAQRSVVISWILWQQHLGADPDIVGKSLELNGASFEVTGVVDRGWIDLPSAGSPTEVWLPLETYPMLGFDWSIIERRTTRFLAIAARLEEGTSLESAQGELSTHAQRLQSQYPEAHGGYDLAVQSFTQFQAEPFKPGILALLGGAFFVLLIGSANASNLMLVRATSRQSELAVHLALGAERRHLVRRLTLEGVFIAGLAGVLGIGAGFLLLRLLLTVSPVVLPDNIVLQPSAQVVVVTLAIAIIIGAVLGVVTSATVSLTTLGTTLRSEGRTLSRSGETWRRALIVVEVACAVTLLFGGLLMVQSFRNLSGQPTGFDPEQLLTLKTTLPVTEYDSPEKQATFVRDLRTQIKSLPGVDDAIVWSRSMPSQATWYRSFAVTGKPLSSQDEAHAARTHFVSAGAIEQLGIRLLEGRTLDERDTADSLPAVVISESTRKALFPNEDPIGQSVHRWNSAQSPAEEIHYTIVGVVADARLAGRARASLPTSDVYYSFAQSANPELNLLVRTNGDPTSLTSLLRSEVRALDPALPLYDVMTMEERMGLETEQSRFTAFLSAAFAAISALLASLGLYSVLATFAQAHRREIGLRMALGGQRRQIVSWMGRQTLAILGLGLTVGLVASLALSRLLEGSLYGVTAWDPVLLLTVTLGAGVVAVLGSLLPLVRAARVCPAIALRAR